MPVKIWTGVLAKYGDIISFTPVIRKIKELIPNSKITFAISKQFSSIAPLIKIDPLIDRVFITENYLEKLREQCKDIEGMSIIDTKYYSGQYYDLRGEDEIEEQEKHDIVFETRIRHNDRKWFKKRHQTQEYALHCCGINLKPDEMQTRIYLPQAGMKGDYIVVHNETMEYKQYPFMKEVVEALKQRHQVIELKEENKFSWIDLACLMRDARLFIGVDSAPMWLASSLNTPTVGIYGINHFGEASNAIYPVNKNATYLQSYQKDFSDISPNKILEEVIEKLKCRQ
jgi:hypothetical protein